MSEELTSLNEMHQEVDSAVVLEHKLHIDEEGVVDSIQNIFLKLDIVHLLIFQNDVLTDTLHSVQLARVPRVFDQEYLTESSLTNELLHLEVFEFGIAASTREHSFGTTGHRLTQGSVLILAFVSVTSVF